MADRFWVGGTGTWNTTSTTNWSATSGGASGASVPTVADSVFFDQAGTYTVTMTGALACLDITVSAGTVTFATGTSPTLNIRGSMSLVAGTVWSSTGAITFSSTSTGRTVTTNGVSIAGSTSFNDGNVGGGWTLGSAFTCGSSINVTGGTFNTANFAVTCTQFNINANFTRSIQLGASTLTCSASGTAAINANATALTFNAGTSQINLTSATGAGITSGGLTFYNVAFTGVNTASKAHAVTGINTFNNFAVTATSAAGVTTVTFDSRQTINGTLSTTGTAGNRRVFFTTATYGISYDLVVNSAPSLTDADFRGLYVRGTAAPISGTRIGNRGECRGITFDAPKTVYWNLAAGGNWSANAWALSAGGGVSTDNFPLAQDTATIVNTGLNTSATITWDEPINYLGSINMSARTSAMTFSFSASRTVYGDWTNGSGTTVINTGGLNFSGGNTQTVTSAGKVMATAAGFLVDTYGGTVQLADALNIGSNTLTVTNGTFDTAGYAVTAGGLTSSNSNVRTINLGASTITLSGVSPFTFTTSTNLTFSAGTSTINATVTTSGSTIVNFGGLTYHNVFLANNSSGSLLRTINGASTFNNLTLAGGSASANIQYYSFSADQTINGTLTCSGASAVRRIFLLSGSINSSRTLTANAISADDCDFRDITLAGAASGASPTRAGDCGGNTGITFPAPKTVYWNLAGTQNWSATAWAPGSGGTPDSNNFPLAQDTAVFDDTGSVTGTITINAAWNIGTFDASLRTSAMTLSTGANQTIPVCGNWLFGTGVTSSTTNGVLLLVRPGTQTITSNGVQFGCPVNISHPSCLAQLADAFAISSANTLILTAGTFDAVTYNVTAGRFSNGSAANTLRMGTGTWTLSGTGSIWIVSANPTLIAGTSTIVLSDTSTSARTFAGGGLYYNKLTIGGTTGTSTLTIQGPNTFGELASTKTVAHTIAFGTDTQTFGKWSVTGTAGNVVTITGTSTTNVIAGPAVTGVDYLAMGTWGISTTSPGEFYAGANSTGTAAAPVFRTAAPAPRTLYWVGGTGNWSSTTKWDTTSGGGGGAAIPTSLDAVNFDSLSNATAYTATIDAGVTIARCASFTMAGPASGNVTFAGSVGIAFHGSVSFAATGITRTYTGAMNWAGNSSYTFTTNGLTLGASCTVIGIGSTWALGSALNISSSIVTVTYGAFNTSASNYALTAAVFQTTSSNMRSVTLNGSTLTLSGNTAFSISTTTTANLTFSAGTSTISLTSASATLNGGGQILNNVSFTSNNANTFTITGANTFNTLSFAGRTSVGITPVTFNANQNISTLTLNAGTASAYRTFLASDTIGTPRTLTVGTLTGGAADIDFRDITIAGAASPISGTRFGDAKGNSGITFPAAKTVYAVAAGVNSNWGTASTGLWSTSSTLGTQSASDFPLAQDTAVILAATPLAGSALNINDRYNIGTIDMSLRTTNTLTLATSTNTPQIYGNWINGTGTTLTGSGVMTFAGRGSQTITSAGKTFTQPFTINTPGGSVTLQDSFVCSFTSINAFTVNTGTFDASTYNFTLSAGGVNANTAVTRTVAIGSGTWTLANSGTVWNAATSTNLTVTGTGTISLTAASAKTFSGGGANYSGITLNQGGAGTLTITGNNTFKDITNTYSATGATTIALGNTTQTVTQWSGTGEAGRVLTLTGTSAASPATLIISGAVNSSTDYLNISNVRGYPVDSTWYIGANSTNSGSLGFLFEASGGTVYNVDIIETAQGIDALLAALALSASLQESTQAADSVSVAASDFNAAAAESAQASDAVSSTAVLFGSISDAATGQDTAVAFVVLPVSVAESAQALDQAAGGLLFSANISELVTGLDSVSAQATLNASAAETAQGADQTAVAASTFNAQASETSTASDAQSAATTFPASLSEQARVQDSTAAALVVSGSVSEIAAALDSLIAGSGYFANVAEQAAALDAQNAAAAFSGAAAETARGLDANSANAQLQGRVTELGAGQDSITTTASLQVSTSESAQVSDEPSPTKTTNPTVAESVTASDVAQAFLALSGAISETARSSDSAATVVVFVGAVAEQLSAADLTSVAASIFGAAAQEQAQAQDSVNAPGSTYNPTASETAQAQDQSAAAATFPVAVADAASISDADSAAFTAATNIAESAQASEIASALAAFAALTAETASAADQTSVAPSVFSAIAVASAQAADSLNAPGSVYNASVADSATALDSLIGGYLWNLINDDQNPNWGPVNNTQTVTWTAVDDSQTPNWQNVTNAQGSGWTPVNTDDDPNWQPAITP
jgi:hypothetical protein